MSKILFKGILLLLALSTACRSTNRSTLSIFSPQSQIRSLYTITFPPQFLVCAVEADNSAIYDIHSQNSFQVVLDMMLASSDVSKIKVYYDDTDENTCDKFRSYSLPQEKNAKLFSLDSPGIGRCVMVDDNQEVRCEVMDKNKCIRSDGIFEERLKCSLRS